MAKTTKNEAQRLAAVANRLRLVQADFADESADVRQEHLSEILRHALSELLPDQRKEFLEALRSWFPTWDATAYRAASRTKAASQSITDQREWNDVSYVLERLIELAQDLPADQREALIGRLRAEGLSSGDGPDWPAEVAVAVKKQLGVDEARSLDPARVLEMELRLAEFADTLDQLAWRMWRTIAPRAQLRPTANLKSTMSRFVTGQADVPLSRTIEDLRHLVASLLGAVSQVGRDFAQRHLAKFSPTEIEALTDMERGGFLVAKEVRCWRKYVELSKTLDEALIEREIMQIIERFVGSMRPK